MTTQEPTTKAVDDYVNTGKNLLALLRDFVLVIIFLMLLTAPGFVGKRLAEAGFTKGKFLGIEWESKAADFNKLDTQLKDANLVIAQQSEQLKKNAEILKQFAGDQPAKSKEILALSKKNEEVLATAKTANTAISSTIAKVAPIAEEAEKIVTTDQQWAVVFSGNSNLEGGQYERQTSARLYGVAGSQVYYRAGSFRVATLINNRSDASAIIKKLRPRYPDAYVVNFKTWCPNSKAVEGKGYYAC
uniref:hypothetical protein n=1 Tax=uncultured Caulobacter sp. TaxID=158749 RepID=UPI0025CDF536|nr:hypothetical protein [uncultured Caulobacter sp.]